MLGVRIGSMLLQSPVIMASGIFSYGEVDIEFLDYTKVGAIVTKTVTLKPRKGNPQPRIWETGSGMLNSIGLQNPGIYAFLRKQLPAIQNKNVKIIVSVAGENEDEVLRMTGLLVEKGVKAVEVNLSCPNVQRDRPMISQSADMTYNLIAAVKAAYRDITLIAKLSPNVTDISEIALSAEKAGADALSLINTVKGLCIDVDKRMVMEGGLSGPPIKPVGLKAVYDVFPKVNIPLIGMGGIESGKDALEYFLAGATAVAAGSGFFSNPVLPQEICFAVSRFIAENRLKNTEDIVGLLNGKKQKTYPG